ncbi:hypothetical protein V8E36_005095 [Tilletia maclaganii]
MSHPHRPIKPLGTARARSKTPTATAADTSSRSGSLPRSYFPNTRSSAIRSSSTSSSSSSDIRHLSPNRLHQSARSDSRRPLWHPFPSPTHSPISSRPHTPTSVSPLARGMAAPATITSPSGIEPSSSHPPTAATISETEARMAEQAAARIQQEQEEERKHFESVIKAFDSYLPMSLAANECRKRSFKSLPPHHRSLLEDVGPILPAPYIIPSSSSSSDPSEQQQEQRTIVTGKGVQARLEEIDDRIRRNADVLGRIVADSRAFMQAAGQYMAAPAEVGAGPAAVEGELVSSSSVGSDEGEVGLHQQPRIEGGAGADEAMPSADLAKSLTAPMQAVSVSTPSPPLLAHDPSHSHSHEVGGGGGGGLNAAQRRERRQQLAAASERERERQREGVEAVHHLEKVRSTIKQFVRDWSEDGRFERDAAYQPIIDAVHTRLAHVPNRAALNILVPGAGLGRLAWEFARRGYSCQGNEFSFYMLIASHFVLNETRSVGEHVLYPYVHSASNWRTARDMLRAVRVPDVLPCALPEGVDFSMVAGEFVEVYNRPAERERWQCVATSFFIDTARNPVQYLEVINAVLELGGYWINAGPLLWHFENGPGDLSIELTLDEVMDLVARMGFEVEEQRMLEMQTYTGGSGAMLTAQYVPAFWVARKVRRLG